MNEYKKLRLTAGLTVSEVAKDIDVDESTIYNWEKGVSNPKVSRLKTLADEYGCSMAEMVQAYEAQN